MPDAELTHPPVPVLRRGKSPGLFEFNALLGLLPDPALVIDRSRETILTANSALIKLTAYSQADLCGARVIDLIPELNIHHLVDGDELSLAIRRHKREGLDVIVKVAALDNAAQFLVLSFLLPEMNQQAIANRREMVLHTILDLSRLSEEPDLSSALSHTIEACQILFSTELVCIYQADNQFPGLTRVANSPAAAAVFPETMPSNDLMRLAETNLWMPGRRVQTEMHRYGRIANLVYLATTPLGQGHALFGLLVIGDNQKEPADILTALMEIVGANISTALQHFLLNENLRHQIEKNQGLLTTHAAVFDNSEEGIIVLSSDLVITDLNQAAEWMLGYAKGEAQNQVVENILIGPKRLMPALDAALHGIPTHNIGSENLHRRSGQSFPAKLQTIPVMKDGKVLSVIIFLTDVSAHEEIQARTQQLEHRAILGDVTAVFAHEVRNPINNISTGLQLVTGRMDQDDPNLEVLNRMEGDCTRLNHLMESVLAFSRPMEHKFEPVDLAILLQRLLDRWRPRLTRVNVEPFFQAAENLPKTAGDPRALEQVFTNLVSNAVEAMNKTGGTLAVKIGISETILPLPQLEVTISDNGPGIPDEIRDRIFEPFVTNKVTGTGLGLAITKRIITAHHGNIKLETFPGGTVFRVFLPAEMGE